MKKILFPATSPIHIARNQLLLNELKKDFEVHIAEYSQKDMSMSEIACDITPKFKVALDKIKPDFVLARGDRFEILPLVVLSAYSNIPVIHLEGFDLSGVIDNRVRYAISYLSDVHFVTNKESYNRAKSMGFENVWNLGSLDVEYSEAIQAPIKSVKPYIMVMYHPVPNEPYNAVLEAVERFKDRFDIIGIKSNHDYGKSMYQEYYSPEKFIELLKGASCVVGNSSALIKECSRLKIGVVNVGDRQANRLKSENVRDCKCKKEDIEDSIEYQLSHSYEPSNIYYQPETSVKIASVITSFL